MSLIDLMARLREQDIRLRLEDGTLRYSAPPGHRLSEELRAELVRRRKELTDFLAAGEAGAAGPVPRRADGPLPLAPVQERLWLLDRMDPGNPAYHMPAAVRLSGELDRAVLERAVNEIVARHEVLRTRFTERDGRPVQEVAPSLHIPLVVHDLRDLAPARREEEARRLGDEEALAPFDLERGPLLRTTLLRIGDIEHILLLTLHHIVADGWSVTLLARELAQIYPAFAADRPSPLPGLALQYGDFAAWHADWVNGEECARQLAHWRERLGGPLPDLDLPLDAARPAVQTFRAGRAEGRLDARTLEGLRTLARASGATLYMTLLAAFDVLLHRLSGQTNIIVGIPDAGRNRREIEPLIGFFVNTLALRTDLSGDPDFRTVLERVRDTAHEAYAHRDVPFEKVLAELKLTRRQDRTPVFQVFFNMVPFADRRLDLPGLDAEFLRVPDGGAKFDLTVYVSLDGSELTLVYNADLFRPERAQELLEQYRQLIAAIVARPDLPVSAHDLVTERARQVLPDPLAPLPAAWPGSVVEKVESQARRAPDAVAVREGGSSLSYRELTDRAWRLAHRLRADGLGAGDVVAVHGPRGADLVCALLAVLGAGAAFLVLDPADPAARRADQVRRVAPRGWIAVQGADVPAELADAVRAVAVSETLLPCWDDLAALPSEPPQVSVGPADLAYVAFTSGSTGLPKAVRGPHGPLAHFLDWYGTSYGLGVTDRFALLSAPGHDPMLRDVLAPLVLGATLCVPEYDTLTERFADWLADERVTVAHLTPATLEYLLGATSRAAVRDGLALRYVFFGGDRLLGRHVELARSLAPDVTCVNVYGATETPQVMSAWTVPAGEPPAEAPLGAGAPGAQLVLLRAHGRRAGAGEPGEIWVRSPHLALGYLDDASQTAERFTPSPLTGDTADRWFRTGDLGRLRPDGTVAFIGRADRQIQIRGFRVEPAEAEARLRTHPAVTDCVVTDAGDGDLDRRLVAWFTCPDEQVPAPRELREHLRAVLPEYLVPTAFERLAQLPRLANGKIDFGALPAAPVPQREGDEEYVAPRTELETALADIWAGVLAVPRVGVHDDFFALGGHSLLATVVTHQIRERLGVEIAVRSLFEAQTVAALAKLIEQQGGAVPAVGSPGAVTAVARTRDGLEDLLSQLDALTDGGE
ncbi:amino acid adenylation domain-containing protein [Streptomyces mexicanus]|uniref:amino acid adenylation domain-containing protein n=1 Tax=Streptomyces mexicanus TaxID=178566 RepID=UPI0036ACC24F